MTVSPIRPSAVPAYSAVVAEDDEDIRFLLSSSLEGWGFEVLEVEQGHAAVSAIRELRPDIALLDMHMPGLTGAEVIRAIRLDPAVAGTPAMLITADTAGPVAESGLADGADDYVRKPFHLGELRERVMRLTERGRDLRDLTALQDAVSLPGAVQDVNGVTAVGLNRPSPGALAGGDFLAVTRSPHGRVTAIVGDVEGHGVEAAALAAFTRAVLATNAAFTDQPGRLLGLADWTLSQRDGGEGDLPLVTATCLVLDPVSGEVRWASAGHPAPVFFADLEVPLADVGLPLGVGDKPYFPMHSRTMAPGDRVLLLTDGLMRATFGRSDFTEVVLPWLLAVSQQRTARQVVDDIHASYRSFLGDEGVDDLGLLLLECPDPDEPW